MKKKAPEKLVLNRETLKSLTDEDRLIGVVAAASQVSICYPGQRGPLCVPD